MKRIIGMGLLGVVAAAGLAAGCGDEGTGGTGTPTGGTAGAGTGAAGTATATGAAGTGAAGAMPTEPGARVVAGLAAWNAGKFDDILATYTDDSEWNVAGSPDGAAMGREEIKMSWEDMKASFSDVSVAPKRVIIAGDVWISHNVLTGTHDGSFMGHDATSKPVGVEYLSVVWNEGGAVKRTLIYADQTAFLKQIGAMEMPPTPVPETPDAPEVVTAEGNPAAVEVVKGVYAAMTSGDMAAMDAAAHADMTVVDMGMAKTTTGLDALKKDMEDIRKIFPDMAFEVEHAFAAGDYVVVLYTMTATHKGDMGPIKATGKSVTLHGADVIRMEGDKLKHVDSFSNFLELADQLELPIPSGDLPGDKPMEKPVPAEVAPTEG